MSHFVTIIYLLNGITKHCYFIYHLELDLLLVQETCHSIFNLDNTTINTTTATTTAASTISMSLLLLLLIHG